MKGLVSTHVQMASYIWVIALRVHSIPHCTTVSRLCVPNCGQQLPRRWTAWARNNSYVMSWSVSKVTTRGLGTCQLAQISCTVVKIEACLVNTLPWQHKTSLCFRQQQWCHVYPQTPPFTNDLQPGRDIPYYDVIHHTPGDFEKNSNVLSNSVCMHGGLREKTW